MGGNKQVALQVKMSAEERRWLNEAAHEVGMTASAWIRGQIKHARRKMLKKGEGVTELAYDDNLNPVGSATANRGGND